MGIRVWEIKKLRVGAHLCVRPNYLVVGKIVNGERGNR